MNTSQIRKLGVPEDCISAAVAAIRSAVKSGACRGAELPRQISAVLERPAEHLTDAHFGSFAAALVAACDVAPSEPIAYRVWGDEIDAEAHAQMRQACRIPAARQAALMPDAHLGYGLPIGGVLGCENTVIPYAVGVDIACRMKLSVLDTAPETLDRRHEMFARALEQGTCFGVGGQHARRQDHAVMDQNWSMTRVTRDLKDRAWKQLGTSGSGNHFVEFGLLTLAAPAAELDLEPGVYVALLSHSGSRGAGAAVCSAYSEIAKSRLPARYAEFGRLAWLDLDSEAGGEYWAAMNLMGDYAAANHEVIHRLVSALLGATIIAGVENHHNFAWKEQHDGRELIVHRKGATPAGAGVVGVIPGTMADPAFVVRGKGQAASLNSAAHGAGRCMSRTKARALYNWKSVRRDLAKQGVRVLSAGADEVPDVYKKIETVMASQQDLVEKIARFDPRIVKMCDDGSAAED